MFNAFVVLAVVAPCVADLRPASQPRNAWATKQRSKIKFQQEFSYYMEPSDFGYEGLKQQRANAYDNFLRSNIDNEQDRRNFDDEPGKDHLPFRNYEGMATDNHESIETQLPTSGIGSAIRVEPGVPFLVPFRWNNPHAAEIEINLWLMHDRQKLIVVPIRKPACSGEGYQDNVFTFKIPKDYSELKTKVPGFKGCEKVGDCVIQFYAHSVESRMYAHGVPVIVDFTEWAPGADATDFTKVIDAKLDPALDLVGKQHDEELNRAAVMSAICTGSQYRDVLDVKKAVPMRARLVSDVFNHAYQNSDFSPYAGQQPERISRNLQASIILKMVPGNRGELGKNYFGKTNRAGQEAANRIDKIARELIRVYETITNQIINGLQNRAENGAIMESGNGFMRKNDTFPTGALNSPQQETENCFRCDEVGSVNKKRLITNTYIPSFGIPPGSVVTDPYTVGLCAEATRYIAPIYSLLLDKQCQLQIYTAVLWDVETEFVRLGEEYGVYYLGAAIKTTLETMYDPVKFIKENAEGINDKGDYAAEQAQEQLKKWSAQVNASVFASVNADNARPGRRLSENSNGVLSALQSISANETANTFATPMTAADANGLNKDTNCENDSADVVALEAAGKCHIPGYDIVPPTQLFADTWQKQDGTNAALSLIHI